MYKNVIASYFQNNNKIMAEDLIKLLCPSMQGIFGFYLQETISALGYSLCASFDIEIECSRLTVNFAASPFLLSQAYTQSEVVDKIVYLSEYSAHIKEYKLHLPVEK